MYTHPYILSGNSGDILINQGPAKPALFVPASSIPHLLAEDSPPPHIALTSHLPIAVVQAIASSIVDLCVLPGEWVPSFGALLSTGWYFGYTHPRSPTDLRDFESRHRLHLVCTPDRSYFTALGLAKLGANNRSLAQQWAEASQTPPPSGFESEPPDWPETRNLIREAILHHAPDLLGAVSHANDRN
jgi:hypothetical protein